MAAIRKDIHETSGSQPEGRVFVLGSSNVDLIAYVPRFPRAGETLFGNEFETKFGGKGANQAVAAAKLGASVTMLTMIGADTFGDDYLKHYGEVGVDTSLVMRTDHAATGIATISVDNKGENCIIVVPGANACLVEGVALANKQLVSKLNSCSVFLIQNEVPASTNAALIVEAAQRGLVTIFNAAPATNLDEPYRSKLLNTADIICVNEEETTALTQCPVETDDDVTTAAAELLKLMGGYGFVLLTLGKRGNMIYGRSRHLAQIDGPGAAEVINVRAPAIEIKEGGVIDTVGAGDSFTGAVATYLATQIAKSERKKCSSPSGSASVDTVSTTSSIDGECLLSQRRKVMAEHLPAAAARANLVSGLSVQRKGAQSSFPQISEVPGFFE